MDDFKESKTSLVADVDCTTEGKPLCDTHKVQGFPSIKYGDPDKLEDYQGARTYEALKKFADENLVPICGPTNLDLCNEEQKALIKKFAGFSRGKLQGKIAKDEKMIQKLEADWNKFQEDAQRQIKERKKKTEDDITAIKAKGLAMMKLTNEWHRQQYKDGYADGYTEGAEKKHDRSNDDGLSVRYKEGYIEGYGDGSADGVLRDKKLAAQKSIDTSTEPREEI